MKIVFVCTGNTCRSPLAEALLTKYAKDNQLNIEAQSCGLNCPHGEEMSKNTAALIAKMDIPFEHVSIPLTPDILNSADYIITMQKWQKDAILKAVKTEKVYSMGDFSYGEDIADPFGGDINVYKEVEEQIEKIIPNIVDKLYK